MNKKVRLMTHGGVLAAVYVVLCHLQNFLFPGSASWAVQFRMAEALCVLAFFTPAAIPGLSLGCLLFNVTSGAGLPLDLLIGTAATVLATGGMYVSRRVTVKGFPLPGLLLPGICNGLLVGWELQLYMGGGFWWNAGCVALGETAVLLTLGVGLYYLIRRAGPARLGIG